MTWKVLIDRYHRDGIEGCQVNLYWFSGLNSLFGQTSTGLFFGALSNSKPLSQNQSWSANLTFDPSSCQALDCRIVNGHRPPMRSERTCLGMCVWNMKRWALCVCVVSAGVCSWVVMIHEYWGCACVSPQFLSSQTAFSAPHSLSSYQLTAHTPHSFNDTPVSHHAPGHSAHPSHTSLMESSALCGMANIQSFDGSSYFLSGNSQSGVCVTVISLGII